MSADIVARGLAIAAARKTGVSPLAFADLPTQTVPAGVNALQVTVGAHAAVAIADAAATAALAAAHPRFCKADGGGRHFRLAPVNGAITVEQGGAAGSGNDQPAIQATLDYAAATGIRCVVFQNEAYELWCPARTSSANAIAADGHPLVVTATVKITSAGYTTLNFKGPNGGDPDTDYQTVSGNPWRGGGLHILGEPYPYGPPEDWAIQCLEIENLRFAGGRSVGRAVGGSTDTSDKGIFCHTVFRKLIMRNVEIDHFYHELTYGGNSVAPYLEVYMENCHGHGSGHSALNWHFCQRLTDVGGQWGDAFIAAAELFTMPGGCDFFGTRFYNSDRMNFTGTDPALFPEGAFITYPIHGTEIPWTTLHGVKCEEITGNGIQIGHFVRGSLHLRDAYAIVGGADIDLAITAIADDTLAMTPLVISGPDTVPTGINAGIVPRNLNIDLTVKRSREHIDAAGGVWSSVMAVGGYLDPESCVVNVRHAEGYGGWVTPYGTVRAVPRIINHSNVAPDANNGCVPGSALYIDGDYAIDGKNTGLTAYAGAASIAVTFATLAAGTYAGFANDQRFRFYHAALGGVFTFAKDGANMRLTRDLTLRAGDWVEFRYSRNTGKWHDVASSIQEPGTIALADAATITPDFSLTGHFEVTLGGNRTLANPARARPGQTGTIKVVQDATGARTLAYGSNWRFPGGAASGGVLTAAAGKADVIRWTVGGDGLILAVLDKDMAA